MITKAELWAAWKEWCADEGAAPGTKSNLLKNLYAAVPGARSSKPRAEDDEEVRVPSVLGLRIDPEKRGGTRPARPARESSGPGEDDDGPPSGRVTGRAQTALPSDGAGRAGVQ